MIEGFRIFGDSQLNAFHTPREAIAVRPVVGRDRRARILALSLRAPTRSPAIRSTASSGECPITTKASPGLGDAQARKLLDATPGDTLKASAIARCIRREELCGLRVKDMQSRQGVLHFQVKGKRGKVRFVPVQVLAQQLIEEYLALAGHATDTSGSVFRPETNNHTGDLDRPLDPASVYQNIVRKYGLETGISAQVNGLCVHSLRATAATNALSHEADIAKVEEWLGHANVSTTRLYDRPKTRPEDSPTFRVRY